MYQFSDSESADSDKGIRYKTDSTRHKTDTGRSRDSSHRERRHRDRSPSPKRYSQSDKVHYSSKIRDRRKRESSSENSLRHRSYSRRHKEDREEDRYKIRRHKDKDYDRSSRKGSERRNIKDETVSQTSVTLIPDEVNDKEGNYEIMKPVDKISEQEISEENSTLTSPSADSFGPALPPHLQKTATKSENRDVTACSIETTNIDQNDENTPNTEEVTFKSCIGPLLPPQMKKNELEQTVEASVPEKCLQDKNDKTDESGEIDAVIVGPVLPPHLQINHHNSITNDVKHPAKVGPILPPHLKKQLEETKSAGADQSPRHNLQETISTTIGPLLPLHLREKLLEVADESCDVHEMDNSEEEVYGPLPIGAGFSKAHIELEERALQMKIDQLNPKQDEPAREEWMLELPAAKASNFGLGPRQFRSKAGPDLSDRSSWTDTPQDKARKKLKSEEKVDIRKEAELQVLKDRDREQEAIIKRSKREAESLVDIHAKKKKQKDTGPSERRPFSREVDLQVNKFDEAQKKAVLKKAQLLDTRFSSGESKFL